MTGARKPDFAADIERILVEIRRECQAAVPPSRWDQFWHRRRRDLAMRIEYLAVEAQNRLNAGPLI